MINWKDPSVRIGIVLAISIVFFCGEIAVGFRSKSLALISDAFHYLNDIVAYAISLAAASLKNKKKSPQGFTFAFHRSELIGAFFNGVFLLALALSIFLQSLERFISPQEIQQPLSVIIVGAIGLVLNILGASLVHTHHHDGPSTKEDGDSKVEGNELVAVPRADDDLDLHALHNHVRLPPPINTGHNLGLLGVFIHLLGDAANNLGVIAAGLIMLKLKSPKRFYADPTVSIIISLVIFASAIPLTKRSGTILFEAAPSHLDLNKIAEDLKSLPDVLSIHDLHIWHLSQVDYIATFHVVIAPQASLQQWSVIEANLKACMLAYGVAHVTIAPESARYGSGGSECRGCETAVPASDKSVVG